MNVVRLTTAIIACLTLIVSVAPKARAADKDKLVGVWEVVKSDSEVPPGTTVEFTKDGKVTIKIKIEDKSITVSGTYEIDGDKLKTVMKIDGKEMKETMTIKTLTDTKLVTVDEKNKTDEFKKAKK